MSVAGALVAVALAGLLFVGLAAARRPLLGVVAFRNTLRRPRQSALVVLGLLVGTALISGALVAGDSMEFAIVERTYQAFQAIDESVTLDAFGFFPRAVEFALADDGELETATDAVGGNVLWDAAVTNLRSNQYEPRIRLVGFDPARDDAFGLLERDGGRSGGAELAPGGIVLNRDAAQRLGARPGDPLSVNFTRPLDPLVPRCETRTGRLAASATGLLPFAPPAAPTGWNATFPVEGTVVRLFAILVWDPGPAGQDLDLELFAPGGTRYENTTGGLMEPSVPAVVDVPGSLAMPLERGEWIARVTSKVGAQTDFNLTLVRLDPVYDLAAFEARLAQAPLECPGPLAELGRPEAFDLPTETRTARVAWITSGGKGPDFGLPHPFNAYVRLDTLQGWLDRPGQVNYVKVSNHGGVEDGALETPVVVPLLWERLNATKERFPDDPSVQALKVRDDKAFWLDQAERLGESFSIFLTFVGSFSVIAGLLLIVNIFTMLAEERKAELGMSRAVGLRRGHLTRLFTIEGALYALPAAVLGTFAGLGLAAGLIWGFNFFGDPSRFPHIPLRIEAPSLWAAFAIGILLTLATIHFGARRISRLNIVRAIRNLEEPERIRGGWSLGGGATLLSAGLALTVHAFVNDSFPAQVLGPSALTIGLGLLLRRHYRRRTIYPPLALALFLYLASLLFLVKKYETLADNLTSPIRDVLLALCVVVLVVYNERAVRLVGALAARIPAFRAVARPATGYPLHRKLRAGLTLAMFAVVLLVISLFTIFAALFAPDPQKEAGGYDVEAYVTVPLDRLEARGDDPSLMDRVAYYDTLPHYFEPGGTLVRVDNETSGQFGPPQDFVYGIDASFAERNRFGLLRRDPAYATDADAYRAVAERTDLAIVAYPYSTDAQGRDDAHGVGDEIQIRAKDDVKRFTIAGVQEQVHFKGVFVARPALGAMFANQDTLFLIALQDPSDDRAAARDLEAAYRAYGMDASSIRQNVLEESQQFRQIFTLIRLFLSLGLIVGILSLGIVTARSVIERRQEIGMMRALGYQRRDIRRTFLIEMVTTVSLGVLIGAAVAVLVSFGVWFAILRELRIPYVVPWLDLVQVAVVATVATVLATLAPIVRAARTPPAEALRYIE